MYRSVVFLSIFLLSKSMVFAQSWQLAKDESGIKIYSRSVQGVGNLKELRLVTEINASPSAIVALLSDKVSYTQWVYNCKESKLISTVSFLEMYHYQVTEMPWPIQNRDIILHSVFSQDKETKVLSLAVRAKPDHLPINSDYIRIRSYRADWKFTPINENRFELEYIVAIDPAGSLPSWVVNLAVAEGPFRSIVNMKELLPSYKNKVVEGIEDF